LGRRTHEFVTFLERGLGVDVAAHLRFDEPVAFHYACHASHIQSLPELHGVLDRAAGDRLRTPNHPQQCCGFGGTFAVEFPEVSGAMVRDKLQTLTESGAELVICNEAGCGLNIQGAAHRAGLPLRFKHLAEALAESLDLMPAHGATA
jgi:L-lactate dehydrogenase complex protein LldE